MIVLGVESSHDDTSIALVENDYVIFNYKISQTNIHKLFGGTVPEIASREHYNNFYILLEKIISNKDTQTLINKIDYVCYTEQPGLIGSLQMGKLFAHALAKVLNKPLKPINHLDGHIFSVLLSNNKDEHKKITYPALALVASGGHTNLYYLKNKKSKEIIGQTLDDAVGEVYDKVARTLNLDFPGGPIIDQIFYQWKNNKNKKQVKFNWPKTPNEFDFSFSGFKTQVINIYKNNNEVSENDIAYSFQCDVINYIIAKIKNALNKYRDINTVILSGGVSANKYLREEFNKIHNNVLLPDIEYSTDNGAMIAKTCIEEIE